MRLIRVFFSWTRVFLREISIMCLKEGTFKKIAFPPLLMGTRKNEGTRHFSRMINSSGIPRLILFISFIRNEAVRALIYTAAPFISSTTLSHTRRSSIFFFAVSLVSVNSFPSFRRWWKLIASQIARNTTNFRIRCFTRFQAHIISSNVCYMREEFWSYSYNWNIWEIYNWKNYKYRTFATNKFIIEKRIIFSVSRNCDRNIYEWENYETGQGYKRYE